MRDIQYSHVRCLAASMHAFGFDYRSGIITVTSTAEYNPTDSSVQDAVAKDGDEKVVKEGLKMIFEMGVAAAVLCAN